MRCVSALGVSLRCPTFALPDTTLLSSFSQATGRTFYIDHNTRSTTWVKPTPVGTAVVTQTPPPIARTPSEPRMAMPAVTSSTGGSNGQSESTAAEEAQPAATFEAFNRTVEDLRSSLLPCVTHALAELFALNGDLHAALYTGSRALNSAMIGLLDPPGSSRPGVRLGGAAGAASSIGISVQRRFVNLTLDSSRQLSLEAFLGIHAAAAQGDAPASSGGNTTGVTGEESAAEESSGAVLSAAAANAAPPRSERLFAHR
jgi:WW domain